MNRRSRGGTDGRFRFLVIFRRKQDTLRIMLKSNMDWVIGSLLETGIGGSSVHIIKGSGVMAHNSVECKGNLCTTQRGLYLETLGGNIWLLYPEVLSQTVYVRMQFLFRERLSLCDYLGNLTIMMNEY